MVTPTSSPGDPIVDPDGGLRVSRPPPSLTPVRHWVVRTVSQLHGLREGVREEVDTHLLTRVDRRRDRVTHDLVLVASELVTNAVRYGRPPAIVELLQGGACFILTVTDHDPGSAPRVAVDRRPGEGGFGLQIVRHLSRDVGWYRTGEAKVVWAQVSA